jgi:extracellular factor (EF) 3-hydroxypalmitic acid methyl ester biosynthesis protein
MSEQNSKTTPLITQEKKVINAIDLSFDVNIKKKEIDGINNIEEYEKEAYRDSLPIIEECVTLLQTYETILYSDVNYKKFEKEYWSLVDRLEAISQKHANEKLEEKLKCVFRGRLYQYISQSFLTSRASAKPFGYGGDYMILQQLYNREIISPTNIGKYYDRMFIDDPLSQAVINRVERMGARLLEFIKDSTKKELHILNIASGAGFEYRLLSDLDTDKKVIIHCFDQEVYSLLYIKTKLENINDNVEFRFYKEDIRTFFRKWNQAQKFDLVYNIGLADYLSDKILKALMQESVNALAPDGRFVIAHKDYTKFPYHYPAWTINWNFIKRTPQDYMQFIEDNMSGFRQVDLFYESNEEVVYFGDFLK